jgi:hypothetical protein
MRDRKPVPGTFQRVLELESMPDGSGDFTADVGRSLNGAMFSRGRRPIQLEQVAPTLSGTPVWLGREFHGFPLAEAFREITTKGRRRMVRLSGPLADRARKCTDRGPECIRSLGVHPILVGPDGVYTETGPIVWEKPHISVVLFYGALDARHKFRDYSMPLYDRPYITLTEWTKSSPLLPAVQGYVPPAGSVFLKTGGGLGVLRQNGLHIAIEAPDEETVLAAARSLGEMPR